MERSTRDDQQRGRDLFSTARSSLSEIASELRLMGITAQAEAIEAVLEALEPPDFQGVLAGVGDPRAWASPKMVEFMARWLTEAAEIVRELIPDAEITGSLDTLDRARVWLDDHGL